MSRRYSPLGEAIVRLGEVAAEHELEQYDGVVVVVQVLLVDVVVRES